MGRGWNGKQTNNWFITRKRRNGPGVEWLKDRLMISLLQEKEEWDGDGMVNRLMISLLQEKEEWAAWE